MADRTSYRFVLRGNTAAGAAASDLPMLDKEIGYETDTGRSKVGPPGDATKYRDIPHYFTPGRYKLDGLADGQGFKWDATLGLMVPTELGKTYQPGSGISIDNPTSATPTINSTLGSIALSGRKEDYAHLPTGLGPGDAGKAYILDSDDLVYIWDGSAFPAEGDGKAIGTDRALGVVTCILSMAGANGSTDFTNAAGYGDGTASGGAAISTDRAKFGGSSLKIGSAWNSAVSLPASPLWGLWQDACFEAWVYLDSAINPVDQDIRALFSTRPLTTSALDNSNAWNLQFTKIGSGWTPDIVSYSSSGVGQTTANTTPLPSDTWFHVALATRASISRVFVAGTAQVESVNPVLVSNSRALVIGSMTPRPPSSTPRALQGYIGGVRVTSGWHRYWDDFTPPSGPF